LVLIKNYKEIAFTNLILYYYMYFITIGLWNFSICNATFTSSYICDDSGQFLLLLKNDMFELERDAKDKFTKCQNCTLLFCNIW